MAIALGAVGAVVGLGTATRSPLGVRGHTRVARRGRRRPGCRSRSHGSTRRMSLLRSTATKRSCYRRSCKRLACSLLGSGGASSTSIDGAVVGMTVSTVLVGVGTAIVGTSHVAGRAQHPAPGSWVERSPSGFKGYAANGLQLLNYRLDVFVLAAVASTAAVGQYSVAVAMTSVLWLLPSALADVLYPRVAHLHARELTRAPPSSWRWSRPRACGTSRSSAS